MRKSYRWLLAFAAAAAVLLAWTLWSNSAPEVTEYSVTAASLPEEFDGFRIVQISDLHNADFYEEVAALTAGAEPDIIVFTGDLVDANHTDIDAALSMVAMAVEIAPCYYVTGNHESWIPQYAEMETALIESGVRVLHNEKIYLERGQARIALIGLDDPVFMNDGWEVEDDASVIRAQLEPLAADENGFMLLLAHRPELFGVYAETGVDLALSGHVHGGQFRLPVLGGVYGPDQGLFPEYDAGLFSEGDTNMIVSRGIGNSVFPLRFNNRPEVVLIELYAE